MDFIHPHQIEELVINLLMEGEQNTAILLELIRKARKGTTKQGLYAALRKLKSEEVVLVYKRTASLNTVWIKKMRDALDRLGRTYTVDQKSFDVLNLEDKESTSYSFSTIRNLDIFWGHSQNILVHNTPADQPIYSYDPHYWLYIARQETEKELLHELVQNKRQFLMTVGYSTRLDKSISADFTTEFLQYNRKQLFDRNNYYVTVIGDYVTEVLLDENVSKKIHAMYEKYEAATPDVMNIFGNYLDTRARSKIKISRNKSKAERLKKMLGKDFLITKDSGAG